MPPSKMHAKRLVKLLWWRQVSVLVELVTSSERRWSFTVFIIYILWSSTFSGSLAINSDTSTLPPLAPRCVHPRSAEFPPSHHPRKPPSRTLDLVCLTSINSFGQ